MMTIRCKYQQSQYKFLGTKQKIKENDAHNKLDDEERVMSSSKVRIRDCGRGKWKTCCWLYGEKIRGGKSSRIYLELITSDECADIEKDRIGVKL